MKIFKINHLDESQSVRGTSYREENGKVKVFNGEKEIGVFKYDSITELSITKFGGWHF